MGARCSGGCDGREDGAVEALVQWQKVSDFLIGASWLHVHPAGAAALRHQRRPRAAPVGAPPVRRLHRPLRPRPPRRRLHLRPPGL